jgi:hypothetical protein
MKGNNHSPDLTCFRPLKNNADPVLNYVPWHEDVQVSASIAPPFLTWALDGGEWWSTFLLLYSPQKSPWRPLDRRLNCTKFSSVHELALHGCSETDQFPVEEPYSICFPTRLNWMLLQKICGNWDTPVGMVSRLLDGQPRGQVSIPSRGKRFSFPPYYPDQLRDPTRLQKNTDIWGCFFRNKAAGAWSWTLSSI